MKYHLTSIRMANNNDNKILKNRKRVGEDVDKMEHLCTVAGNGATIVENSMIVTQKIKDRITI